MFSWLSQGCSVLNTLKTMVIEQYVLDKEDMYILDRMMAFVTRGDVVGMPAAKALKSLIERAVRNEPFFHIPIADTVQQHNESNVKSMITTNPMPAPTPIMPRFGKKLKLLDIDPLELARQLTIMESKMYQRIKPIEALKRAREQKMDVVDDIGMVIQTSNRVRDCLDTNLCTNIRL
jgi:son of sevenless-like protein